MSFPPQRRKGIRILINYLSFRSPQNPYIFSVFSQPLLFLAASLYLQTGIKWLLTEGDKLLISAFATLEDQGMYALSANYGGLIARMLFRPIEDSSRNLFAKLCAPSAPPSPGKTTAGVGERPPASFSRSLHEASTILNDILRIYNIASLIAFAIGPTAAPLLLQLVAGGRWANSGASAVLATYCYCIPLLAINGVSEAFVAATATTEELRAQSLWMTVFSAGFAVSAYIFLRVLDLGAQGLVWANCVNMALRIVFNLRFASGFFRSKGVSFRVVEMLPNVYAVGAAAVAMSVLTRWQVIMPFLGEYGLIGEFISVGAVGAALAMFVVFAERSFLLDCCRRFRS